MDEHGAPPDLVAFVNGMTLRRFKPSLNRPDLSDLDRMDLGFDLHTDQPLKVGDIVEVVNSRGEHLSGSPKQIAELSETREEKALCMISKDMKLLEIGPSYNPLVPRSRGWNSFSLDHVTKEELQAKYRGQQQIERIEPVDYLWNKGPIESAVPLDEHGTFDAIVASHVIEHIPDPIAFFLSASALLKKEGLVSLVIPDKRIMFDFFKPVTLTSDYLHAHYLRRTRHSRKVAFDNIAYNVTESGDIAWSKRLVGRFGFFGENVLTQAKQTFDQTIEDESAPYVDFHGTIYTPSSFALIILELSHLGVIPLSVARTFPTSACEFYVTLNKGVSKPLAAGELREKRFRLMKAVIREQGEMAHWLESET